MWRYPAAMAVSTAPCIEVGDSSLDCDKENSLEEIKSSLSKFSEKKFSSFKRSYDYILIFGELARCFSKSKVKLDMRYITEVLSSSLNLSSFITIFI